MQFPRCFSLLLALVLWAAQNHVSAQDIRISEFLVTNTAGIVDNDGTRQGWIEIWNPSRTLKQSLSGWKLTDGVSTWTFPFVEILPDDRLLVWASGKNRTVVTAPLHTNFTLNAAGGTLQLVRSGGSVASAYVNYPAQQPNVSYGQDAAQPTLVGTYSTPTPEDANNYSGPGVAGDVAFSVDSSSFTTGFQLTLSQVVPAEGAEIRYTLNGTVPSSSSTLYTGPITISATTQVRARVFAPGLLPGGTETEGYLWLDAQSAAFSSQMPVIVLTSFGINPITDGSSTPPDNAGFMWVWEPGADGRARIINPPTLHTRVALDRRGSSTLGNPKVNLNVEARKNRWDEEKDITLLGMPAHSDWVFSAPYEFDRSLLHNPFMYALSNTIGRYATRTKNAEVFVDVTSGQLSGSGDYYGVYNIMEKIRRGGDRVDIEKLNRYDNDLVSKTGGYIFKVDRRDNGDSGFATPRQNSFAYYYPKEADLVSPQRDPQEQYLRSYLTAFDNITYSSNWLHPTNGYRSYLDVDAAIDHHLLNVWSFNVDGLRLSGYLHKDRGGKIIYGPIWDFDRALSSTDGRDANPMVWRSQTGDLGTDFFNYTWWNRLFSDINFYQAYIDRWVELRRGAFSPTSVNALIDQLNSTITAEAVNRDVSRWQKTKRPWTSPFTGQNFSGQAAEIQRLKDWLQQRANFMDSQWVAPVTIDRQAGSVTPGTQVSLSGPNGATIYYTLDGSDPRPPGGLAPNGNNNVFIYSGTPLTIDATTRIRARAFHPTWTAQTGANNPPLVSRWSGPTDARFSIDPPAAAGNLIVTEINYHPADPTAEELAVNPALTSASFEFLEVKNIGTTRIDLGGAQFTTGVSFAFTGGNAIALEPGEYAIIAGNPEAFAVRYGSLPNVVGPFQGDLANGGEKLVLVGLNNETIVDFTYDDAWYPLTDGPGNSLVVYNQAAPPEAFSTSSNWRASTAVGGSPGAIDVTYVTTEPATALTGSSAQLNATILPEGPENSVVFIVGGVRQEPVVVSAENTTPTAVGKVITGLNGHTRYSYTVEVTNSAGVHLGKAVSFTTLNRSPEVQDRELHLTTRAPLVFDVLEYVSDPDGDAVTLTAITQGTSGVVSMEGTTVTYTPGEAYTGNDSFTYTVADGLGGTALATVTLRNSPPQVQNREFHHVVSTPLVIDVLASTVDPDGDTMTLAAVTQGTQGTVSTDGLTITYTPGVGYAGNDSFTYTVSDASGATASATVTLFNSQPVAIADSMLTGGAPVTIDPRVNDTDADGDALSVISVTQGSFGQVVSDGSGAITYTPGPNFPGRDSFSYTITDGVSSASVQVTVNSNTPIVLTSAVKGGQVPGQPAGTVYSSLGLPAGGVFSGSVRTGANPKQKAIFGSNGTVLLKVGEAAPQIPGATIAGFAEPSGQAVLATVRGTGVNSGNNSVLYAGLSNGVLRIAAREGAQIAPGVTLGKILSVDGNGETVFFLAKLKGSGASALNNLALCASTLGSDARIVVRKGDLVNGESIVGLATLVSAPQTAAAGRWRVDEATIGVRLTFPGKVQALYTIPAIATSADEWTLWMESGQLYDGLGIPQSFGLPGFGPDGVAHTAQLVPGVPATVTTSNDSVLLRSTAEGVLSLAQEGGPVAGIDGNPLPGLTFRKFADPLAGKDGRTAFLATLAGSGLKKTNKNGIWVADGDGTIRLLARTGDLAPGGGTWLKFESFALSPENPSKLVFTAQLALKADVTTKNNRGIWGVDSTGSLKLLLRTGQPIPGGGSTSVVKKFVALTSAAGSLGAARGFDADQALTALVTFADGTQSIVRISIP